MYTDCLVFSAALLPVLLLLFYIWRKDRTSPEPSGQLVKGFFFGVLSAPLSLCISMPLLYLGCYELEPLTVFGNIRLAFFGAAIPEEVAKLLLLWLLLRKSRHFDQHMDGIVYAVCISLGFAAYENITYLFGNYQMWLSVGIVRALFAIPGHFAFGVLMGYYYSLQRFSPHDRRRNRMLLLAAPILAHGLYDAILMVSSVTPSVSVLLSILFLWFCHRMWKYANRRIADHLQRDNALATE